MKKILLLSIALVLATAVDMYLFLNQPMSNKETVLYELSLGSSVSSMSQELKRKGLIKRHYYISLWARVSGQATKLKAGEYKIEPGMSPAQLLNAMVNAKVQQYSLTLVEGWTIWQMMSHINASPYLKHTLIENSTTQIMKKIGHEGEHPEGRFYPDTYYFPKGMSDVQFLKRAYQEMSVRLQNAWASRDHKLPFKDPYEALIMASIVEKESALAEERTRIAGVFINRLNKRMRLQTDPTVIYGLGEKFNGDIRFRDLRNDTPYNTYTRKGLPPTPIAMPGQGAINAVMRPDTTEYLYFVARGDQSGSHVFSTNLKDHKKAVDTYQRKRRPKK
jgi:peptidoglycan lytic transglycosylase G